MEPTVYLKFLLALIIVLGMIFALAWVLKRFGLGQNQTGPLGRKKRLRIIETANLDSRHRLVLIRRDAVEHLVLLSPSSSQLIESGIPAPADEPGADMPALKNAFKSLLGSSPATKDTAP